MSMGRTALVLCGVGAWVWPAVAGPDPAARLPKASFAHLVPQTTGVFVEVQRLRHSDRQLRRANLWSLAQLLLGENAGRSKQSLNWRALVGRNLGVTPEVALTEIFGQRVAVAAPSWQRLADAVIVARLKGPRSLDPVIGPRRAVPRKARGPVRIYRTITGLWVATDGRVAAFSRDGKAGSLFSGVVELLSGRSTKSLSSRAGFAEHVGRLSRGYAGCLYFASLAEQGGALAEVLPAFGSAAVGMYVRGDRLDFEVRATLDEPRPATPQPIVDLRRLERLPDSTLLAWATSVDLPAAYRELADGEPDGLAGRYLGRFQAVLDLEAVERDVLAKLGPRVILVWDRLRGRCDVPQLAVMLESSEPKQVARALADGFARVARALRRTADAGASVANIQHLETEIHSVSLAGLLPAGVRGSVASRLVSAMEPSFAALDGWVVAATSPAQIRQIVDAYEGWIPALGSMDELRVDRWRMGHDATVLAVAQPAMAAAVAARWEAAEGSTSRSPMSQVYGSQPRGVRRVRQQMLGIGVRKGPVPGEAVVARVRAKTPARGKLRVGDRILGVDGRLLSLTDPVRDVRRRIAECADPTRLTLRVRRGDQVLDVLVPIPDAIPATPPPSPAPAHALRQLQSLGRAMSYAVYSVARSEPDQFHARISLHLISPGPGSRRRSVGGT